MKSVEYKELNKSPVTFLVHFVQLKIIVLVPKSKLKLGKQLFSLDCSVHTPGNFSQGSRDKISPSHLLAKIVDMTVTNNASTESWKD